MKTPDSNVYTNAYTQKALCPICGAPLMVKMAYGRKSKKPFISLVCPKDGRHFRAFINDQQYVKGVLKLSESQAHSPGNEA